MANKQTAVKWLEEKMTKCYTENDKRIVFRIAKAMEKEQISNGYYQGLIDGMNNSPREYYEETYGK